MQDHRPEDEDENDVQGWTKQELSRLAKAMSRVGQLAGSRESPFTIFS